MSTLKKIVYLTEQQYSQLATGTLTGHPEGIRDDILYITTDEQTINDMSGVLSVPKGGTGKSSFGSGKLLVGNGSNALNEITATNASDGGTIVKRDNSGNFSAGTITATLDGNATSASTLLNKSLTTTTVNNTAGSYAFSIPATTGMTQITSSSTDYVGLQIGDNVDKWQLTATGNNLFFRQNDNGGTNTSWNTWVKILDSNTTSAGTNNNATLTWATTYTIAKINGTDIKFTTMTAPTTITGNAGTATALETARTLWGQSFDGSADITGNLIDVGDQIKLLSEKTELQFLTSTGDAANGKFGKLGLNTTYANIDFTNYVLDVNGKARIGALDGGQHIINGNVQLNAQSGSYNEGLRINRSTTGYANIYLGGTRSSDSGNQTGGWWIGTLSTPANATSNNSAITNTVFTISNNNTTDTLSIKGTRGATIGTNSGWAIKPRLAVGTTYQTGYTFYVNGTSFGNDSITLQKAGEVGLEVDNTQTSKPNKVAFIVGSSGNGGIYSRKHTKWIVYADSNGNVTLNGNADTATTATNLSAAPTITAAGTATVNLAENTTYTLTVGGKSVIFKTPADSDTNTLMNYTLGATTRAYLMGSQNAPATSTVARAAHGDLGVYLTNIAGQLSAKSLSLNDGAASASSVEKVWMQWNSTDQALEFVFA